MPTHQPTNYAKIEGESEVRESARLISLSFAGTPDKSEEWLRAGGLDQVRLLRGPGGTPIACLMRIPMAQFFGGRSVPMIGIAGVAVAPEARGQGAARALMSECLREIAREGVALSTLYASTQELYRQVGYEQAGLRFITKLSHNELRSDRRDATPADRALTLAPATPADEDAIRACYAAFAKSYDGMLDRGPYCWTRTRRMRDTVYNGFLLRNETAAVEGYVFLAQERDPHLGRHNVIVSDYAFTTGRAARRLVDFLASFSTMMLECLLPGGPLHPLAHAMAQQRFLSEKKDFWMVRLTDVSNAFKARGFPAALRTAFDLDISDDLIDTNTGRWCIEIAEGQARATRTHAAPTGASTDTVSNSNFAPKPPTLHIRALAALFAGLVSARQAATLGWLAADEASLENLQAAFPGSMPVMTDHF